MLSLIPVSLEKVRKDDLDRQIVRAGIIAELDAINLYEQMATLATSETIRAMLLDIVKEEKTHVGEFQAVLLSIDKEQERELEGGGREVAELQKK